MLSYDADDLAAMMEDAKEFRKTKDLGLGLVLNYSKTQIIGHRRMGEKLELPKTPLVFGGAELAWSEEVTYLGI